MLGIRKKYLESLSGYFFAKIYNLLSYVNQLSQEVTDSFALIYSGRAETK